MAKPSSSALSPSPLPISRDYPRRTNGDKFVERVIFPAVLGQSCPICLETLADRRVAVITACKHAYCLACIRRWSGVRRICPLCNCRFDSWFYAIDLASRKFLKERLPLLPEGKTFPSHRLPSSGGRRRLLQVSREDSNNSSSRSRPLPWRRSFGRPGSVPDHVIFEKKLQWRASIYNRRLQAIPISATARISLEQNVPLNDHLKARIVQRIEPWIRRELQAVLGDPDPSIIVHVASSLFIRSLDRKHVQHSEQTGILDDEFSSLQKFLYDKAERFWHELRAHLPWKHMMRLLNTMLQSRQKEKVSVVVSTESFSGGSRCLAEGLLDRKCYAVEISDHKLIPDRTLALLSCLRLTCDSKSLRKAIANEEWNSGV